MKKIVMSIMLLTTLISADEVKWNIVDSYGTNGENISNGILIGKSPINKPTKNIDLKIYTCSDKIDEPLYFENHKGIYLDTEGNDLPEYKMIINTKYLEKCDVIRVIENNRLVVISKDKFTKLDDIKNFKTIKIGK